MAFGSTFGNPTTSAPAFGATSTFGFGNTSAPASTSGFSFGSFGAATTTASTGFSFGAPTTSATPFSFPSLGTTTTTSSFGFGGFGTALTTTTASGFSFGPTTSAFGGGSLFSTGMGMQQPGMNMAGGMQPQNQGVDNAVTSLVTSLTFPMLYGDERDAIIAKWNQLQASWGTGKGYYNPNAPPVEFTPENPFCCFKAVGYSCLPSAKPEDSLVGIVFNKKDKEIISQQQQVIDALHKCFGSKPTISVSIDGVKALTEDRTEVVFYLLERLQTGLTRRIPPAEICTYLEQPNIKAQISTLGVLSVAPKTVPSKEQIQNYLDNPPADDIAELNRNHTTTVAKIAEHKRKLLELQHRVLKVLVHQEITRKMGYAIQADEEQLRIKLEAIQAELSAPTQFKGHLKELTSQIRMQNYQTSVFEGERYCMDEVSKEEIKEQLLSQQEGISLLINIIKEDMADLKTIEEIINEETARRR
ncbi:nucleoporin p54 [Caerostris darwini]|uniref:Nucleoporin p54 n=1 Tax=Caerostris darwini TaxID=1538125 RepID=A0AAV4S0M7_9ARAC|nr:nucleoporin p54 [Caerostris darwini]